MASARRGRPVEYDRARTLERARDLFWATGFATASLDALSEATGMTRPSLAGAFGDKEALYVATLERYRDASAALLCETLSGTRPLRAELAVVYRKAIGIYLASADGARGCFLIGTASVEAVHRPVIRRVIHESMEAFNAILEARFRKAAADGELPADADAPALAALASAVMHSLAVRARAGDSRRALEKLAAGAVDLIGGKKARRGG